jgi:glycosyltransferase involved in cell wall biosynthesis
MNDNTPSLVSVIIPIHNRFDLADQAVKSVFAQTHRPIEIIIVDDCSEFAYKPPQNEIYNPGITMQVSRLDQNKGPGFAREAGRILFKGSYLCYLDSDDLWHPSKIEKQIHELMVNPKCGMCYCLTVEFAELPITGSEKIIGSNHQIYDTFLPIVLFDRPWSTSACMWTRKAINLIGPWINARTYEDVEYDCRAGCQDISISHIPEILVYKRNSPDIEQLSSTERKRATIQKVHPIREMTKWLISSRKITLPEINDAFYSKVVKRNLKRLIDFGEFESAIDLGDIIKEISPSFFRRRMFAKLLVILIKINRNIRIPSARWRLLKLLLDNM